MRKQIVCPIHTGLNVLKNLCTYLGTYFRQVGCQKSALKMVPYGIFFYFQIESFKMFVVCRWPQRLNEPRLSNEVVHGIANSESFAKIMLLGTVAFNYFQVKVIKVKQYRTHFILTLVIVTLTTFDNLVIRYSIKKQPLSKPIHQNTEKY